MPDFHNSMGMLQSEMGTVISSTIFRLSLATLLGGLIGLERQLRHKPAGLRTNLFICFGAAMYTILSSELAGKYTGDHTRIAAQIIPGIGFIGAGSILHGAARWLDSRRPPPFLWSRRWEWQQAAGCTLRRFLRLASF